MDSSKNSTSAMGPWTQSEGIPNLFMLPKDKKKDSSNSKIEFGASGEDKEGQFFTRARTHTHTHTRARVCDPPPSPACAS